MTLTKRRKEFLARIKQYYEKYAAPVHYGKIAEMLGVSKWTAYDILKELEKEGYLKTEYLVSSSEKMPGRSMILFAPTSKGQEVFEQGYERIKSEWNFVRERLLLKIENLKSLDNNKIIEQLLEEMSLIKIPIIFSAYTIVLLLVYLKNLGGKSACLVKDLINKTSRPEMGLTLFSGIMLGSILKLTGFKSERIHSYINRFQERVNEFAAFERNMLLDFLKEAMERAV